MRVKTVLEAALWYAERGFSVIPLKPQGKEPAISSWRKYQKARPTQDQVRSWFTADPDLNVGLVCGPVSGNLVVIDFDDPVSYQNWEADHRQDAGLPRVRTSRGWHVYLRTSPVVLSKKFQGGEIRSAGTYVVAPPSVHEDGSLYQWFVEPPETIHTVIGQDEINRVLSLPPISWVSELHESPVSLCPVDGLWTALQRIIKTTQPDSTGQRHRCLWHLARHLKAIPELASQPASDLVQIVREWHKQALPKIRTKTFSETMQDFCYHWEGVKVPAGSGLIDTLFGRAMSRPLPKCVQDSEVFSEKIQRLTALCRELQRQNPNGTFYLSCRVVGELLDLEKTQAAQYLKVLQGMGFIRLVQKGTKGSRQASEYCYLMPLDE